MRKQTKVKPVFLTLATLTRDSEKYIVEHALFHFLVGFDRLIYILHICQDQTEQRLLKLRKKLGLDIVIHHCKTNGKIQMGTIDHITRTYKDTTEWLAWADDDEYLFCVNPTVNYKDDIKSYLRQFKDASAVSCNSKVFGPSRHITRPDYRLTAYTERFTHEMMANKAVKTFIRPDKLKEVLSPHYQNVEGTSVRFDGKPFKLVDGWRSNEAPLWSSVVFNHFHTGSLEDTLLRYKRGSTNDHRPNSAYGIDYFLSHTGNMEYDNTIQVYCDWHLALIEQAKQKGVFS